MYNFNKIKRKEILFGLIKKNNFYNMLHFLVSISIQHVVNKKLVFDIFKVFIIDLWVTHVDWHLIMTSSPWYWPLSSRLWPGSGPGSSFIPSSAVLSVPAISSVTAVGSVATVFALHRTTRVTVVKGRTTASSKNRKIVN